MLVSGEVATETQFANVLQDVVKSIPDIRIASIIDQTDGIRWKESAEGLSQVELVVVEDSTFAAARGAAFWMWMRLDGSYCDEWCAANPGECNLQYDAVHDEL